jgi:hypothetical protein
VIRDYNLNDIYQVDKSVNEVLSNKIEVRTDKFLDEVRTDKILDEVRTNKTGDGVLTNKIDDDANSNNNVDTSTNNELLSDIDDNDNDNNNRNDNDNNDHNDNSDNHNNAIENSDEVHSGDNNDLLVNATFDSVPNSLINGSKDSITSNNNNNRYIYRYMFICIITSSYIIYLHVHRHLNNIRIFNMYRSFIAPTDTNPYVPLEWINVTSDGTILGPQAFRAKNLHPGTRYIYM